MACVIKVATCYAMATTCVACGQLIEKSYQRRCLARCDSDVLALWTSTQQKVLDDKSEDEQGIDLDAIGE